MAVALDAVARLAYLGFVGWLEAGFRVWGLRLGVHPKTYVNPFAPGVDTGPLWRGALWVAIANGAQ